MIVTSRYFQNFKGGVLLYIHYSMTCANFNRRLRKFKRNIFAQIKSQWNMTAALVLYAAGRPADHRAALFLALPKKNPF